MLTAEEMNLHLLIDAVLMQRQLLFTGKKKKDMFQL